MTFVKAHVLSGAHENLPLTMLVSNTQGSDTGAKWLLRFWAAGESPHLAGHPQEGEGVPTISILIDADDDTNVCHALANDAWAIRDLILESDNFDWTLSCEEWISAFEGYTEVANLSVRGQVARSLCGALDVRPRRLAHDQQDESGDGGQLRQQQFLFRKLSRVEIKCVDFNNDDECELSEDEEESESPTATVSIFDMLKTSLAHRRAAANIPLTLYLRRCSMNLDQLRELREIVEVVWDLFEGSDDNSAYYNRLL
ncbi:hypothetical protein EWM64_g4311 [Hericium alpestre]|uniref:Uncharacterized protein n=1 Tax=Hericium alpestre TaxID=135208 RepID=A0A4Y9ZZV1_9AGAM|nr:hypothetical protein EWM64_g4311 [Hericium alpestre]